MADNCGRKGTSGFSLVINFIFCHYQFSNKILTTQLEFIKKKDIRAIHQHTNPVLAEKGTSHLYLYFKMYESYFISQQHNFSLSFFHFLVQGSCPPRARVECAKPHFMFI